MPPKIFYIYFVYKLFVHKICARKRRQRLKCPVSSDICYIPWQYWSLLSCSSPIFSSCRVQRLYDVPYCKIEFVNMKNVLNSSALPVKGPLRHSLQNHDTEIMCGVNKNCASQNGKAPTLLIEFSHPKTVPSCGAASQTSRVHSPY